MTENRRPSRATALVSLAKHHHAQITQQRRPFTLRMHCALSWLQRAEATGEDDA